MVEVEKFYKKVLPGEMVFYVDDSAVFTNEIKDVEDFGQKIKDVNEKITVWMNELYEKRINLFRQIYYHLLQKK